VVTLTGWERVLWGSEYPVFYWRSETLPGCRDWLSNLLPDLPESALSAYLGGNAARVLFNEPPSAPEIVTFPAWLDQQFNRDRNVPLFQNAPFELPMAAYARLHHQYVIAQQVNRDLTFAAFMSDWIIQQLRDTTQAD
jgi:hypothetical protein